MNEPKITCHPRSLARAMAKKDMERKKMHGVNRTGFLNGVKTRSYFARSWKETVREVWGRPIKQPKKKKTAVPTVVGEVVE